MKSKINIFSLDDMVFEGRNTDYGAYQLRKTYKRRLLVSFCSAIAFFVVILSIYPISNLVSPKIYDVGYPGYRTIDLKLDYQTLESIKRQQSLGSASESKVIPPEIIDDEQVAVEENSTLQQSGNADSVTSTNTGSGAAGTGNSTTNSFGNGGDVYGSADVNPQFSGGPIAMQQFITDNFHYPEIANSLNISGTILIYVVIMSDGTLRDVKVVRGLHPELDAEAIRVVKAMPLWKPAKRAGIAVNVRCTLPITVSSREMRNHLHK